MKFAAIVATLIAAQAEAACQPITTVEGLDLVEFSRASWYVQAQQVTRDQPAEDLFCLTATYDLDQPSVPFFSGTTISVNNYGNNGGVNGDFRGGPLCGRLPNDDVTSKLLVAPCFLPNFAAGDYWVAGLGQRADSSYEWALVVGGQPDREFEDGCTTPEDRSSGGLWLLSRDQVLSDASLADAADLAASQGITMQRMLNVPQLGCEYRDNEFLKIDEFAPSLPANATKMVAPSAFAQSISWSTGSGYASTSVAAGDDITFVYTTSHDVWRFDDFAAYAACDFSRATQLAGRSDSPFTIQAPRGTSYYGCSVGSHCTRGNQNIEIVGA